MEQATSDLAALDETVAFLNYFKALLDRRQRGKVVCPLDEVLLLALLAVLCGMELTRVHAPRVIKPEAVQ